jgi:hypothetical protein
MAVTRLTTNGLTGTKYDIASADNYYMEPIATTLGTGSSGTITFSNIPQGYKHLQIRMLVKGTSTSGGVNTGCKIEFNGDTTSTNYYRHSLTGNGSSASAAASNSNNEIINAIGSSSSANVYGINIVDILDYANTSKYKTVRNLLGQDNNGSGIVQLTSGLWSNTAPITSIALVADPTYITNWTTASRFSLYGIKG